MSEQNIQEMCSKNDNLDHKTLNSKCTCGLYGIPNKEHSFCIHCEIIMIEKCIESETQLMNSNSKYNFLCTDESINLLKQKLYSLQQTRDS